MTNISTANYSYFSANPRKIKISSEEIPPLAEQSSVPSSNSGVQGGKVALQAGGTLLGATFAGGTAGWLTHQQELEASKKSASASEPETPVIPGIKEKVLTPAQIEAEWNAVKAGKHQEIKVSVFNEHGAMTAKSDWFHTTTPAQKEQITQQIPKSLDEVKDKLEAKAKADLIKAEVSQSNKKSLKSAYGVISDTDWTTKVNEVQHKVQRMRNFDALNQFLSDVHGFESEDFGEIQKLLKHDTNQQLLRGALATNDQTKLETVINNLTATGLDADELSIAKNELRVSGLNTASVNQVELLAYQLNQADTTLTWEQAKTKAQAEFNQNRQKIEAEFKTPAKVAEVEGKAKQLWDDAQAKITKEIAQAEADFRVSKAPKVKPTIPKVNATMVEDSFFKEVTKGGKTAKIASGVALGTLILGAGLTAYSAYQDGQRKLPTEKPTFSAEG